MSGFRRFLIATLLGGGLWLGIDASPAKGYLSGAWMGGWVAAAIFYGHRNTQEATR